MTTFAIVYGVVVTLAAGLGFVGLLTLGLLWAAGEFDKAEVVGRHLDQQ